MNRRKRNRATKARARRCSERWCEERGVILMRRPFAQVPTVVSHLSEAIAREVQRLLWLSNGWWTVLSALKEASRG